MPTKHGHFGTPIYFVWNMMRQRCTNPRNKSYKNYGAKGITVCDRWQHFANFLEDMGERPSNHTLDRIDNAKGYSPENCRWVSWEAQQRHRTNNHMIECDGRIQCLEAWAKEVHLDHKTISYRLNKGWPPKEAIFTPAGAKPSSTVLLNH